jgi:multiple sugar transport system permease protein
MSLGRGTRETITAYVFLAPAIAAFAVLVAYPVVDTFVISFQNARGDWIGLTNYSLMLSDDNYIAGIRNTLGFAVGLIPVGVLLTLVLAGLISSLRSPRGQAIFRGLVYLPIVAGSPIIFAVIWQYIYDPRFGAANLLLGMAGLPPQLWLNDPNLALWSVVLMLHTQLWGGMVLVVAAAISGLPGDIIDAATVDGAGSIRRFIGITVPLIRPALAFVAVLGTISVLRLFDSVFLMTHGGPALATTTIAYNIYETGITGFHFARAAAYSVSLIGLALVAAVLVYGSLNVDVEY